MSIIHGHQIIQDRQSIILDVTWCYLCIADIFCFFLTLTISAIFWLGITSFIWLAFFLFFIFSWVWSFLLFFPFLFFSGFRIDHFDASSDFLGRRNVQASSSDLELFDLTSHFILSLTYADCDTSFTIPFFHDIPIWHRVVFQHSSDCNRGIQHPLPTKKEKAFRLYYTHFFHSFILSLSLSFPSFLLFLLNAEFPMRHHTMPIFHTKPSDFRLTNRICNIDDAIGHDMDLHMHMDMGTRAMIIESILFSYPIDS